MLIILIPITLVALFLHRLGIKDRPSDDLHPWQGEFLIAVTVVGAILVVVTEFLSLLTAIHQLSLALSWSIILIVVLFVGWRKKRFLRAWQRIRGGFQEWRALDTIFLVMMGAIVLLLLLIALVAPSNNVDAMQYHLPRVLHWAQNQSLQHYPVARRVQNIRPYWSEAAILHLRVLWGNDGPVNLVQWFSMITSVLASVGTVTLFGGKRLTRWLTAAFVLSIPMGVLQATTALNDYASTMWVIVLAFFVVLNQKRELVKTEFMALALALGLGMLTKGTFFPYAAPLMAWFFLSRMVSVGLKRVVVEGVMIGMVAILLNLGLWSRNVNSYGGLYGNRISVGVVSAQKPTPADRESADQVNSVGTSNGSTNETTQENDAIPTREVDEDPTGLLPPLRGPIGLQVTKISQMLAMNFVTPVYKLNQAYFQGLSVIGGPFTPDFVKSLDAVVWNNEHLAGSPLHMILIFVMIGFWVIRGVQGKGTLILKYSIIAFAGFTLVSFIDYATNLYAIRYHLAFIALGAPVVGYGFEKIGKEWIMKGFIVGLLLYSLPYVMLSNLRPLVGMPPWPTKVGSILTTNPSELLFALSPDIRDEYEQVVFEVEEASCQKVGLLLDSKDLEYTFWWLFEAPQSGVQLRFVTASPEVEIFLDPDYEPCAIICTKCQGEKIQQGLPIASDYGHIQLFLEEDLFTGG